MVLSAAQLLRRRSGDRLHRWNGRVRVELTGFVAVPSSWIQDLSPGHFSRIHILSVVTIVSLAVGLVAIRRHHRTTHGITMASTYAGAVGALIGVVAVPVRLVPRSFQADWPGMALLTGAIVALTLASLAALSAAARRVPVRAG